MTFNAKNLLFVILAVGGVCASIILVIYFFVSTPSAPLVDTPIETVATSPDPAPAMLRESTMGTVLDTEARYGFFTIMDASGFEKAVTMSKTTRILQTVIQYTEEGEEVRRVEREVNIDDLRAGTEVEIATYIEKEGDVFDVVRFTSSTTRDVQEYINAIEPKKGFLLGEVTGYDVATGVLTFKRFSPDGVFSDQDTRIILDTEQVMVYEFTNREKPSIFHAQTFKTHSDIQVGDMVRIFIKSDEVTESLSVYAVGIILTL